jgi:hypothetical protein
MRNIFVPQTGHVPCTAFFPFFMVTFFGSFISLLALHFTQYALVNFDSLLIAQHQTAYKRCKTIFLLHLAKNQSPVSVDMTWFSASARNFREKFDLLACARGAQIRLRPLNASARLFHLEEAS